MNINIDRSIDAFIETEKNTGCNPYLHTRVMALIEKSKDDIIVIKPSWKYVLAVASLAGSIWAGVAAGEFYKPAPAEYDIVLSNDSYMESVDFSNDGIQ